LQSIPGYNISPDDALFRKAVSEAGCAIIGQTTALAPADRRLYAIRDVTATVESVPLITASILSKKLAAGLQSLVLDVKVGNGAFMNSSDDAQTLARSLVDVANGAGLKTTALLTDMNEPLADAAGNALEIANCLDFLAGRKAGTHLEKVVFAQAAEMLVSAGVAADLAEADTRARAALGSGQAREHFARMVHGLGGPADFCERPEAYLQQAPVQVAVRMQRPGYLADCDTRAIGLAVVELGGGRKRAANPIDHRVGIAQIRPLGSWLEAGDDIAVVHAATDADADKAVQDVLAAYSVSDQAPEARPAVLCRVS
jgi:thymidine phosphorylase